MHRSIVSTHLFVVNFDKLSIHLVAPTSILESLGLAEDHVNRTRDHPCRFGGLRGGRRA